MQVEPRHVALALEVVDNSLHDGLIVPLLFGTQRESALYVNTSANTSEPQQSTERIDSIEGKDSKCTRT
jgi:hypothetical protein